MHGQYCDHQVQDYSVGPIKAHVGNRRSGNREAHLIYEMGLASVLPCMQLSFFFKVYYVRSIYISEF